MTRLMASTPAAAMSTDSGAATPPPRPDALITPATSGIPKAAENAGSVHPTDWATRSGHARRLAPSRS
jgi:hypothetical protein